MQASAEKIWGAAQEHLRSMLSPDTYNLWFAPLRACGQHDNSLVLEVANDFCEVWLKDNYLGLLQEVVALAVGPSNDDPISESGWQRRSPLHRTPRRRR